MAAAEPRNRNGSADCTETPVKGAVFAKPDSIMVRVDFDDRAELLAGDPAVYYLPDHYVNYPGVLVRLSRVNRGMLRDLLGMAHKFVSRQPKRTSRKTKRR